MPNTSCLHIAVSRPCSLSRSPTSRLSTTTDGQRQQRTSRWCVRLLDRKQDFDDCQRGARLDVVGSDEKPIATIFDGNLGALRLLPLDLNNEEARGDVRPIKELTVAQLRHRNDAALHV